jgi:hypothetical protein
LYGGKLLENCFETGTRLELHSLGSLDLNLLASLWIDAGACGTLSYRESTKADELNVFVLLNTLLDALKNGFDGTLCDCFGGVSTECFCTSATSSALLIYSY